MIREEDLAKLSYPDAPKMVTDTVPGPKPKKPSRNQPVMSHWHGERADSRSSSMKAWAPRLKMVHPVQAYFPGAEWAEKNLQVVCIQGSRGRGSKDSSEG
jgi:hypothetical protein